MSESGKIGYKPVSAGSESESDEQIVLEVSAEDLERERRLYVDFPDPGEVRQYSEAYNKRALVPMREWVMGRVADADKMIQYEEVINELDKFSPKYCCDIGFCRRALLPDLRNELQNLPASLIAVLYTLHLVHGAGTRLISAEKQGNDISFEAEFDSYISGGIVTSRAKYVLQNYLSPTKCDLLF